MLRDVEKILVSGCLLGQPIRYDGTAKSGAPALLARWHAEGRLVATCPELAGGFPTPRPPAEIAAGRDGADVLDGTARVVEAGGADVTPGYLAGAHIALALARAHGCRYAVLTDASPSCGSTRIYDGRFAGATHPGAGVTAALLRRHGIVVFAHDDLDRLAALL